MKATTLPDGTLSPLTTASPKTLALWLAIIGGDMPGFDNGDRANLRRIAQGLSGALPAEKLHALCTDAVMRRDTHLAWMSSRPEAVLLAVVFYLVVRLDAEAGQAPGGAGPPLAGLSQRNT
jgi:hypothetical protein